MYTFNKNGNKKRTQRGFKEACLMREFPQKDEINNYCKKHA